MSGFNPLQSPLIKATPISVVLLLDVSRTMAGVSMNSINSAVKGMIVEFSKVETSEIEIFLSIISFGLNDKLDVPYACASNIDWTLLQSNGAIPMDFVFKKSMAMIENKETSPLNVCCPTIVLVSDGACADECERSLRELVAESQSSQFERMAMAIGTRVENRLINQFILGSEHGVFIAKDSNDIQTFFQYVTTSVTRRALLKTPVHFSFNNKMSLSPPLHKP